MQEFRVVEVGVTEIQIGIAIRVVAYLILVIAVFRHPGSSQRLRVSYRLAATLLPFLPMLTLSVIDLTPDTGAARAMNGASFLNAYYMAPAMFLSSYLFSRTKRPKQNRSLPPSEHDANSTPM